MTELVRAVREFFAILDQKEESDSGTVFSPNYISSCRVMDAQRLGEILKRMKEQSERSD